MLYFRKQCCIANPLVAQEMGWQTHHGLTRISQKMKISFAKGYRCPPFLLCRRLPKRCSLRISPHNQQILPRNRVISILGNMPIGSFKKRYDHFGKLSVSPCLKSRNGGSVIWDHLRGYNKNPLYSLNIAPTKVEAYTILEVDGYGMKAAQSINLIL